MDAGWLEGKQVAFTGKLASLTRAEAAGLVRQCGGKPVASLGPHTAFLVVGSEGLPLTRKGALTRNLQKARRLEKTNQPAILSEQEFLDRLGLNPPGEIQGRYTMAQLCRLLRIPPDRLRSWVRQGLLRPVETVQGIGFFDFRQVTSVKALWELARAGVTPARVRRSLEQLKHWLGGIDEPLAQLAAIERDGRLLFRLEEGQLAEPSGQLQLDFHDEPPAVVMTPIGGPKQEAAPGADHWGEIGLQAEEAGKLPEAVHAYRQALLAGGPDPQWCFNLGNALWALGEKAAAAERFREAVELDGKYAAAWNNLGNVLADLDQVPEAIAAFGRALKIDPGLGDAHFNLADVLEDEGRREEARPHWQAYLRLEAAGPWARHARKQLRGRAHS